MNVLAVFMKSKDDWSTLRSDDSFPCVWAFIRSVAFSRPLHVFNPRPRLIQSFNSHSVHLFAVVWDAKHVEFELVFLVEIDVVNLEAHFPGTSALAITEETSSIMPSVRPAMNPCLKRPKVVFVPTVRIHISIPKTIKMNEEFFTTSVFIGILELHSVHPNCFFIGGVVCG